MFSFLILLLFTSSTAARVCLTENRDCQFRLCSPGTGLVQESGRRVQLRPVNIASNGPLICRRNSRDNVGPIVSTGEPMVVRRGMPLIALKDWRPAGLNRNFAPGFFSTKVAPVRTKSTIVRKQFRGNQEEFIDSVCIRVPIISYRKFPRRGSRTTLERTLGRARDCLAFESRTSNLLIEFEWDSKDDLDMQLLEPTEDGRRFTINKNNRESPSGGKLQQDFNSDQCFTDNNPTGKERILYRTVIPPMGTYTVSAFHFTNCGKGPTRWRLRVSVGGDLILSKTGFSNGDFSSRVFTFNFTI